MALEDFKDLVATSATLSSSVVLLTGISVCKAFFKNGTTGEATAITFVSRKILKMDFDNMIYDISCCECDSK